MALPAPRSPLDPGISRRSGVAVHRADALAPARGTMIGLTVALAAFWGPLAIGVLWLLN